MALLDQVYRESLALFTDLYELTMAQGYWKLGMENRRACFQLFFRTNPFGGGYALTAGAQLATEFIEAFCFQKSDLSYLEGLKDPSGGPLFEKGFLDYLETFSMTVDVEIVEEGTPVFAYEPMLQVQGPIIEAQILESALLNLFNFQTLIATKASRLRHVAGKDHVVEFGMRRAQGIDGAIAASRAAYIGGCDSSSNVLAGKLFGIPVMGTHAHSWVMSFEEEAEAFEAFARVFPKSCIFLIDTYDSIEGAKKAVEVGKKLRQEGIELLAVRLDSGDLQLLSQKVRQILDEGGFAETKIMATNELTEEIILKLKEQGTEISIWGVGTNLVTAKDQPALDGVYKLSAVQDEQGRWQSKLKISEVTAKTTHPGRSQVRRFFDGKKPVADMLYDLEMGPGERIVHHTQPKKIVEVEKHWTHEDLLVPMLRKGAPIYPHPSMQKMRERGLAQLRSFGEEVRRIHHPQPFFAGIDEALYQKKCSMIEEIRAK